MIISNYVSYDTTLVEDMIKPLIEDAEHFFKKDVKMHFYQYYQLIFSLVDDFYSTMNYNFQTIIYKIK